MNEQTVTNLYHWLKSSHYSPPSRKKYWGMAKRFLRFLFQSAVCAMPRNLDSREFRFKVSLRQIMEYSREQVRQELATLPPRLRLYALLAINFGMRNTDIAECKATEYDGRYLTHKRVKTDSHDNVPVVRYKLWPETIAAIESGKAHSGTLLFCSLRGTALVEYRYEGDEVRTKDLIYQQFKRRTHTIPLAAYRSIDSTIIGGHREYGRYTSHYLGHSPKGIADRHYVAPSQELFDEIMTWLRKQVMWQ